MVPTHRWRSKLLGKTFFWKVKKCLLFFFYECFENFNLDKRKQNYLDNSLFWCNVIRFCIYFVHLSGI